MVNSMDVEQSMQLDTGCLCDPRIVGGKVGLYSFSQEDVHFLNLHYTSLSSEKTAQLQSQCSSNEATTSL